MVLSRILSRRLVPRGVNPEYIAVRALATSTARDPIQQLFLDKITEYKKKASSAPDGLVDADASTKKAVEEEAERIRRNFGVKTGEEGVISTKFTESSFKLDSINQKDWK